MARTVKLLLPLLLLAGVVAAQDEDPSVLWPEDQRGFLKNGPGLLLQENERTAFIEGTGEDRETFMAEFLDRDPDPGTPENELREAIRRRLALVRTEFLSLLDDRARVVFLHGFPENRELIECGMTFNPLEIWTYAPGGLPIQAVFYQPAPDLPYRLWFPVESKRALYIPEMQYWLEQWEELKGLIRAKRFDLQTCPETKRVDEATGIEGLRGFKQDRPTNQMIERALDPPEDLAAWALRAATTELPEIGGELPLMDFQILYPEEIRQRMLTIFLISIPEDAGLELTTEDGEDPSLILEVEGVIEHGEEIFDEFKSRFRIKEPGELVPIALAVERALRPDQTFVVNLRVADEIGGRTAYLSRAFTVPREAQPMTVPPVPEGAIVAMGEQLAKEVIAGADSLILIPPETDIVLGLWRAEALVTGSRIVKVAFLVDGQKQMTRSQRPFSAELRLAQFPSEQAIRAEGYDENGEIVATDEVVLNQPRGALRVRILEPQRGEPVSGRITSRAEVVVPEERRVESVEFRINEESVAILERPPWQAEIEVPPAGQVAYMTVVATLDDGSSSEEVRFLNAPQYLEQVEVKLVELFTTVTDKSGRLARGLTKEEFEVREDGRPQEIQKFELVENLPLTLGFAIDTSGSMVDSLPEARAAAIGFLENIITPRDKVFAVSFSDKPVLLIPPTDDVDGVEESLEDLRSVGWTTLHDAVVTSLYYFRGVRGRRALIVLSDGDDTASSLAFAESLEYARRSGVAIFTVGLDVGNLAVKIRRKLANLAEETGGRSFFIHSASELAGVYQEIEDELRSQYLVAYSSDRPQSDGQFRLVEVTVRGGKLKARTIRGYYP